VRNNSNFYKKAKILIKNPAPYILGLDIGTNSIGWAVVDCNLTEDNHQGIYAGFEPVSLRALNARIFQEMVEAKTQVPKNQKRRTARGARNRRTYYQKRRRDLINALIENGLLPRDYLKNLAKERVLNGIDRRFAERKLNKTWSRTWSEQEKSYSSPYAMRYFALKETLEPYELGRLLLHLQRRRGYRSNRGAKYVELIEKLNLTLEDEEHDNKQTSSEEKSEEKKEPRKVLDAISQLDDKLGGRTIGQFIWEESQATGIPPQRITLFRYEKNKEPKGETLTERLQYRAKREMHETEFDKIWEEQKKYHDFPPEMESAIKKAIFHQRPLQSQKGKVGSCNIYPNKKRAAVMRLEFQEFRTLQVINNIKVDGQPLTDEQRQALLSMADDPEHLNQKGRISWSKVKSTPEINKKSLNYGRGEDGKSEKAGLPGNRTIQAISKSIGYDRWKQMDKKKQTLLIEDLLSINNKRALYDRLVNHWKFEPWDGQKSEALDLAMNEELEAGYGKHSLKAINALLPHMRNGRDYYAAVEKIGEIESITPSIQTTDSTYLLPVKAVPNIANPIVQKALYEMRRVINSIIKRYGKPAIIRIEMAREMKASKKHRAELAAQQQENLRLKLEAEKEILEHLKNPNIALRKLRGGRSKVKDGDIKKYIMWHNEQDEQCPYSGKPISFNQLFSGATDIDHILPYTGYRENHMNTVVCLLKENQNKGKRTPFQTWGADSDRWDQIEKFAKEKYKYKGKLYSKQLKILEKNYKPEEIDDFVERQLNDTRYIATATKAMLKHYGVPIDVNNGAATSQLRGRWGLNEILPRDPDADIRRTTPDDGIQRYDKKIEHKSERKKALKSRRDHRHHAIDAFIVAMTDRAMLKEMVDAHQKKQEQSHDQTRQQTREDRTKETRLKLPKTWKDGDVDDLHHLLKQKLNATVVSHMVKRKVWGTLHDETRYGKSHFNQELDIEGMGESDLKKVIKIAETGSDSNQDWIADENLRSVLLQWATETLKKKPSDRSLPCYRNKEWKKINYQTPCITIRKEISGELLSGLAETWSPGSGTWIAEESIHNHLYQWLDKNKLVGKTAKEITKCLKNFPPCLPNRHGKPVSMYRVRMARAMSNSYTKIAGCYMEPGSNHHFVLFHNGKQGKEKKRKIHMVTMLEVAQRASAREMIIDKTPSPEWEGEWYYELALCVNDMVVCEDLSIFDGKSNDGKSNFATEHKETPWFRVQKMSSNSEDKVDMTLRHHSISGTDTKWGEWRIASLNKIACRKVQIGNLGLLPDDPQDH